MSWIRFIPYPPSRPGYWHPVTSTLNWCEEDYYATIYSAEIVNSMTNLLFVCLAFSGIRNCIRNGHDSVFLVAFTGYLLVGVGSFLFHSTLKYFMQLADELPMIYTTCITCYATFSHGQSRNCRLLLALLLVSIAAFITIYYLHLQDPVFHQNAYAILTATVVLRSMYIMETQLRPSSRSYEQSDKRGHSRTVEQTDAQVQAPAHRKKRDTDILRTMWALVSFGLSVFIGGFVLWSVDNKYCSTLRSWRREVGLPWGILLEGHGWWHLMTGLGAYCYIVWGIWLRHCLNGRQDEYALHWPSVFSSIPQVVRVERQSASKPQRGHVNGVGKSKRG